MRLACDTNPLHRQLAGAGFKPAPVFLLIPYSGRAIAWPVWALRVTASVNSM